MMTLTEACRWARPEHQRAIQAMKPAQCLQFIEALRKELVSTDTTTRDKILAAERPGKPIDDAMIAAYNTAVQAALVLATKHMDNLSVAFIKKLTRPR